MSGSMAYSALLPAAIASFTASATSHALGLEKFSVLLSQTLSLTDTKTVTYLILFGILFGLTGRLFAVLCKSKTVYGKRTGKSIQENRLCVDPTGGVSFSGVERTVLRTWNQSDRAGIFRWRTVYV